VSIDLSLLTFSGNSDVSEFSNEDLFIELGSTAATLAGDDLIRVTNSPTTGLTVEGDLQGGTGNDRFVASALQDGILNLGTINTGNGDDTLSGRGESGFGIANSGTIILGDGEDTILADGNTSGLFNDSLINMASGADTIRAFGRNGDGILNASVIFLGDSDDVVNASSEEGDGIDNRGLLDGGTGKDIIRGSSASGSGIKNDGGSIFLARGDDKIIGKGGQFGIYNFNSGLIGSGPGNDLVKGEGTVSGIFNQGGINTDDGSDQVVGIGGERGIQNESLIQTSEGNDFVVGTGDWQGISCSESGRIFTGSEDDVIAGEGDNGGGVFNAGIIFTDTGDDTLFGSSENGIGVYNSNLINFANGSDRLVGVSSEDQSSGIVNDGGSVFMGRDSDSITGKSFGGSGISNINNGILSTGSGADALLGEGGTAGIFNQGTIDAGADDDSLIGRGSEVEGVAIWNEGFISMGDGNDTVNGLFGGFSGGGAIDLGAGNDTILGFGDVNVIGGSGSDRLLLDAGTYLISDGAILCCDSYVVMTVQGFERIGSATSGETVNLRNGTLVVESDGDFSYA